MSILTPKTPVPLWDYPAKPEPTSGIWFWTYEREESIMDYLRIAASAPDRKDLHLWHVAILSQIACLAQGYSG